MCFKAFRCPEVEILGLLHTALVVVNACQVTHRLPSERIRHAERLFVSCQNFLVKLLVFAKASLPVADGCEIVLGVQDACVPLLEGAFGCSAEGSAKDVFSRAVVP